MATHDSATRARLCEERFAFQGKGSQVTHGMDGPTFCVCSDDTTSIEMLQEDDVTESDRRRGLTIRRFTLGKIVTTLFPGPLARRQ
jgi:hypothetical protein